MPGNVERRFGKSDGDFERAQEWARDYADDRGVLHVIEDFTDQPWTDDLGVIWVVSSDRLDAFMESREAQDIDAFGLDADEQEGSA